MEDVTDNSPSNAVESDPQKRYWRFEDVLGRGAFKTVFKAFDSTEGIEVAWNKVVLGSTVNEDPIEKRLFSEIRVLKRLKHKNIMTFHDYWLDEKTNTFNFITELFTHGSLKKFRAKHKHLELKVLKRWTWQILQGLVYLHGHEPPIIHRDLKCDNILINGVTGDIKIGDLGLATLRNEMARLSVIGTPEFMAPEFYDEQYNEKVDVYAFGMLLLELVSMNYPYSECSNPAAIYKKVSHGVFPASLRKIENAELRKFIEICIAYAPNERPEARKLLKHPFFDGVREERDDDRQQSEELDTEAPMRGSESISSSGDSTRVDALSNRSSPVQSDSCSQCTVGEGDELPSVATSDGVKIRVGCRKDESEPTLHFTLMIAKPGGVPKNIEFPFDINADTAEAVVDEMREEGSVDWNLLISEEEAVVIGDLIAAEVEKWKEADQGDLTAYLHVTRKTCDALSETQNELETGCALEACERLESKMGDIGQMVASNSNTDQVFQAMSETTINILTIMKSDSKNRPWMHTTEGTEDEFHSDGVLTQQNMLYYAAFDQQRSADEIESPFGNRAKAEQPESSAIDIPWSRRWTSAHGCLESSRSVSSTMSDSRIHHDESTTPASLSCSISKQLSFRRSSSEWTASAPQRPSFIKSLSMMVDRKPIALDSPATVRSPQQPVAFAACIVGPTTPPETPQGGTAEKTTEVNSGVDPRQASLISFISTTKPTPKKGDAPMPPVPEAEDAKQETKKLRRKADQSIARSKADEWQWTLANCLMKSGDTDSAPNVSPPNSLVHQGDSGGSIVDHGSRSPQLSQDLDACDRSDANATKTTELKSRPPSTSDIDDVRHQQELKSPVEATSFFLEPSQSCAVGDGLSNVALRTHSMSFDVSSYPVSPPSSPIPEVRSASEFGGSIKAHSTTIRAFRRDDEGAIFQLEDDVIPPRRYPKDVSDRANKSCVDMSELLQGTNDPQPFPFFPSPTPNSDFETSRSLYDGGPARVAAKHPRGSRSDGVPPSANLNQDGYMIGEWTTSVDFPVATVQRKQETTRAKELLRKRASESIDKMQEQQLAGLCSHAAVGVARGKPIGPGKNPKQSMKSETPNP